MKSKLLVYFIPVILASIMWYGYDTMDDPTRDIMPIYNEIVPSGPNATDTTTPSTFPYERKWAWNYAGVPGVSSGTVGACYFKGKFYMNKWNTPADLYLYNADGPGGGPGTQASVINGYNAGTGAVRDMTVAPDGSGREYLWGGVGGAALYKLDSVGTRVATYTHTGATYRTIAWDPNRKGFWSSDFNTNIICRDTTGAILRTITATTLTGKYGLAWDSTSSQDSAFLWAWGQDFSVPSDTTNNLWKIYLGTGAVVKTWNFNKAQNIAGGAEIFEKNNELILNLNFQNFAVVGYKLKDLAPPPSLGNSLVLIHDSTVATSQTQRKADQDTLKKYLPRYVGNYTIQTFDTTTTLPNLSDYDAVFLVETSFDAAVTRYLGATARTQLKAWLNSGTSSSKKTIIAMGGDLGWNYSRTGSPSQDLGLSQDLLKYTYVVDNGNVSPNNSTTGSAIDAGNVRTYTTSPAGGGFWPDGCNPQSGGSILYYYTGGSTTTNVGGIGYIGTNYVSVAIFQDPRYFTNGNFGPVLYAAVQYAVTNGGIITGFNSGTISTIADRYELAQNYPNPFNPATTINFSIPKSGLVTLKIYDILGKEVATLVNEIRNAGSHTIDFNASALSSGTYFYRIESGDFKDVKKMMLLK